jgi:CheY-like chemotaxis protein
MTANVFKEDIEHCLAAGMNEHLGKPIEIDLLIKALRRYLLAS